jgi:trehalose/maltose transport system permease protein
MRARARLGRLGALALAALLVGWSVFPLYWAIVTSLQAGAALYAVEPFPRHPDWGSYAAVFREQAFGRSILNSIAVALSVVALSLALSLGASHALGRVSFRGRRALLAAVLCVSTFPQVAVLSGLFELVRWLGLYDSLASLSLSYLIFTLPFTTWVLTAFVRELPRELEEAATVEGATPWIVLTRVFLPLLGPALVTTGLLAFIAAWNELLFALTFTLSDERRTVPVAIALLSGASQFELPWGRVMAASVVVTVPLVLLVLVFQRRIVSGLTAGAVKG